MHHLFVHTAPSRIPRSRTHRKIPVAEFTPRAHNLYSLGFVGFNKKFVSHRRLLTCRTRRHHRFAILLAPIREAVGNLRHRCLISRLPSIASRLTCAAHRSIYTFTRAVPLFLPVSSVRTSERQGGQDAKSCPRNSRRVSFDFTGTHLQRCRPRHRILQISLWRHGNHAHARPRRQDHARRGQNRRLHHFHKR